MKDPLLDKDFLLKLDSQKHRTVYAKIVSLTFDENPIEEITGNVTGGSINIDGASAIRRSCNLTLVAQDININEYYWGLNTKFKLSIGIKNNVDSTYPDIIWFKQGTYLITSFNTSLSAKSYTISISGKDKMCLLNGDIGGEIESVSADFGTYDEIDEEGNIVNKDYLLKDIILEAVHHYGKEPFHNIVIEDLDQDGLELMEYRGDKDLFLLFDTTSGEVGNMRFDDDTDDDSFLNYFVTHDCYKTDSDGNYILDIFGNKILTATETSISLKNPPSWFVFDNRISTIETSQLNSQVATIVRTKQDITDSENKNYTVAKITYGDTCGYRLTDLTYAGDLILSVGDNLTQVLDKIVTMLGDYEYFYNLDGQFVFRKKHIYTNTSWNSIINNTESDETYVESSAYTSACTYSFTDSNLVSSFQNNPNLSNLRNDFSIWGKRDDTNGTQFHLRYAIDKKPVYYKNYNGYIYLTQAEFDRKNAEADNAELESTTTVIRGGSKFRINALIDGLSDDWWEIGDWTRRYLYFADVDNINDIDYYINLTDSELVKIISDAATAAKYSTATTFEKTVAELYNQRLGLFATEWPEYIDWLSVCPYPSFTLTSYSPSTLYSNLKSGKAFWTFLVDVLIDDATGKPYIAYVSHGGTYTDSADILPTRNVNSGCYHKFYYAIQEKANGQSDYTYIYKPQIPDSVKMDSSSITIKENNSTTEEYEKITTNYTICDWREIIYQMAVDYYRYGHNDDFNPILSQNNQLYFPSGYTGYEQYYTDMQGFWRYIYNPDLESFTVTSSNINTLIPDPDKYNLYTWDSANQTFNDFTFKEATNIKDIPDEDIYYTNGTISLSEILKLVNENKASQGVEGSFKSHIRKTDSDGNDIYYCYQNSDDITWYHWIRDDLYQVYKKYHNFKDDENYYKYGLALDLTDLDQDTTYFYPNKDTSSNQLYIPGQKLYLNGEYTYIGKVSEASFKARDCQYYTKSGTDTYTIADVWNSTKEYYKVVRPTNFNNFGTNYYEFVGYTPVNSIASGNTYYKKVSTPVYKACTGVLQESDGLSLINYTTAKEIYNIVKTLSPDIIYVAEENNIYTLCSDDTFNTTKTYYIKNSDKTYSEKTLDNPDGPSLGDCYYLQGTEDTYKKATEYQANTYYYYYKYIKKTKLDADSYEANKYYVLDDYNKISFDSLTASNLITFDTYYTRAYGYVDSGVKEEDFSPSTVTYYYKPGDKYAKATGAFQSGVRYYEYSPSYTELGLTSTTYDKNAEYWYMDTSTGKWTKDTSKKFDIDRDYYKRVDNYVPLPTLTRTQYEEGSTSSITKTDVTYYIFKSKKAKYQKATGAYSSTETYYIQDIEYILLPNLKEKKYTKNTYYVKNSDGKYVISSDAFVEGAKYYDQVINYITVAPTKAEYDGKYLLVKEPATTFYIKTEYAKVASNASFDASLTYYYKRYLYTEISELPDSDDEDTEDYYYTANYDLATSETFDSTLTYYYRSPTPATVTNTGNYDWSKLYTKESKTIYTPVDKDKLSAKEEYWKIGSYKNNDTSKPKYVQAYIYFKNKYYVCSGTEKIFRSCQNINLTTSTISSLLSSGNKFYKKNNDVLKFEKAGTTINGYFDDGIHTFYLKSGANYIKQTEYDSNKKDQYFILDQDDQFIRQFEIKDGTTYYEKSTKAIVTNFSRGFTYCTLNADQVTLTDIFTYESGTQYYIYSGYVKVKSTEQLVDGNTYLQYNTTNMMTNNYKMYPTNIYYGYTSVLPWDETVSEKDYYIKQTDGSFNQERILHHFVRGKTYYVHEVDIDPIDSSELRMELINDIYYKDDNDNYINCISKAKSILTKYTSVTDDALLEIYGETGLMFSANPTSTSATLKLINTSRTYYIKQCDFREYNTLVYNFSPLPVTVYDTNEFNPETYWTFNLNTPENLLFWFDFIDSSTGSELSKYGVDSIGNRPKSVNDEDVKAIYYRDTPNVIFIDSTQESLDRKSGYTYLNLTDNIDNLFAISSQGKTTFDVLNDYLYNYSYCTESITLSAVPVYYLEPNTRIFVYDPKSGINGEYLISKITVPLAYNGTMSISATKAVDRIY